MCSYWSSPRMRLLKELKSFSMTADTRTLRHSLTADHFPAYQEGRICCDRNKKCYRQKVILNDYLHVRAEFLPYRTRELFSRAFDLHAADEWCPCLWSLYWTSERVCTAREFSYWRWPLQRMTSFRREEEPSSSSLRCTSSKVFFFWDTSHLAFI